MAIDSTGRIVIAGSAQISTTDRDFVVARLTSTGSLDTAFDSDGLRYVAFDLGGGLGDRAFSLAIQTDGKIVVAGEAETTGGGLDFAVARLLTNGSFDSSFDGDGKAVIGFDRGGNRDDGAWGLALAADGGVVVVGDAEESAQVYDGAILRLLNL